MSGKESGQGERGRTSAPRAPATPGVTTRSRSRGLHRAAPYPAHPPGAPSQGVPSGPAFHPRSAPASQLRPGGPQGTQTPRGPPSGPALHCTRPQATPLLRGSPCGPSIQPRASPAPLTPRGPPPYSSVRPTRYQATPLQSGGVKRAPPRCPGSPAKRGPASPPPSSRGTTPSPTYSGGMPGTPSKGITEGLARCTIGQQGTPSKGGVSKGPPTRSQGPPTTTSWAGVTQGPTGGQSGMPSTRVIQQRYFSKILIFANWKIASISSFFSGPLLTISKLRSTTFL